MSHDDKCQILTKLKAYRESSAELEADVTELQTDVAEMEMDVTEWEADAAE